MPFYRSFQTARETSQRVDNNVNNNPPQPFPPMFTPENLTPQPTEDTLPPQIQSEVPGEEMPDAKTPDEEIQEESMPNEALPDRESSPISGQSIPRPLYPVDYSTASFGGLRINTTNISTHLPIEDAVIQIRSEDETTPEAIEEIRTDASGQTTVIELPTPPLSYSEESGSPRPYSKYTLTVRARGYEPFQISGTEILPEVVALQQVQLLPLSTTMPNSSENLLIPEHTLYGVYPPKIAEDEVKELSGSGEIVLSEVVIPEYVVVHDGTITNTSAQNYYVRYRDYIKNVASSEIYATWPEATIYANILAIQSFTLNRVYTEWYRNRGYNFTITSSTAYDHKWIPNRNIFDTISEAVDNIFNNYLSRPNISQPILTQYCDGKRVSCPGLMSQWGSKYLGDEGYTAIEILRNYYGSSIFINTTEQISGVPSSYPGEPLSQGDRGEAVRQIQSQLNAIADVYYNIPNIAADSVFGPSTEKAVRAFQRQFNLSDTGIVDFSTWYKISEIYVAITKIAEYTR